MDNLGCRDRSTELKNILFRDTEFQPDKWPPMHRKAGIKAFPKGPGPLGLLVSLPVGTLSTALNFAVHFCSIMQV